MRRLMVTMAVVLGVAVCEVHAQHHESEEVKGKVEARPAAKAEAAKPTGKKAEAGKPKADDAKKPAEPVAQHAAKADAPPSVNELAENIGHVAIVIDSRRGRVMPVRQRLGLDTKEEGTKETDPKTTKVAKSTKELQEPKDSAHAAPSSAPRVELNWRAPLLVWPAELVAPQEK